MDVLSSQASNDDDASANANKAERCTLPAVTAHYSHAPHFSLQLNTTVEVSSALVVREQVSVGLAEICERWASWKSASAETPPSSRESSERTYWRSPGTRPAWGEGRHSRSAS